MKECGSLEDTMWVLFYVEEGEGDWYLAFRDSTRSHVMLLVLVFKSLQRLMLLL